MKVLKTIAEVKEFVKPFKCKDELIGFVPTMGALHEGHLALGEEARYECDCLIYSIFVNPTQFGPNEDLDKYPRDIEADIAKLEAIDVDAVFLPDEKMIYPDNYLTYVNVKDLGKMLCGKSRVDHFEGVTTVVTKLFNIIECDEAYFGKKDIQQFIILKKMVEDLNMPVKMIPVETVREEDGLAKSSRNAYLSEDERKAASVLFRAMTKAKENIDIHFSPEDLIEDVVLLISEEPLAEIEYVELRRLKDLSKVEDLSEEGMVLVLAVKFGKTRLIDNMLMK
ncbi:MAG: pantoate--beta-alanine ligase [Candidatus Delongbacteria bacterium]|jgi:pantoate--beta-alanine ligase|nr:pantoate--beta-alanine ligase [Candidatus Delongbacteria bacterium]